MKDKISWACVDKITGEIGYVEINGERSLAIYPTRDQARRSKVDNGETIVKVMVRKF